MEEMEIVRLLRERDQRGVEELLLHYGPLIRYILSPILPDPRDREECVSEIAMKVWEKIFTFDPSRGSWNSWLIAVSRNTALNQRRRGGEPHGELTEDIPSPEPTPEEAVLKRERREELERTLRALSSQERTLFYRKYYYLQSTRQIASELGTTERAVEGRLYRLKKRLYKALGGEDHE